MERLSKISLSGFKTIKDLKEFELRDLNLLIGPNGAGKSNFISFFKMMNWMTGEFLQDYVGRAGYGNALLYEGSKITQQIAAHLVFETEFGINEYRFRLTHVPNDTLMFTEEQYRFSGHEHPERATWKGKNAGHKEADIMHLDTTTAIFIRTLLRRCQVYQFHDTSDNARIKQKWSVDDNIFLKNDGYNLASYLLNLQTNHASSYRRIIDTIRLIVPFFQDFCLEPENNSINLRWREKGSDLIFGPHMASDGSLRTMALITLLLQPEEKLPAVIILDEPELGLHPYAINVVAGLLKSVSQKRQVILATQSLPLLNYFEPEDIVVVERKDRETTFKRQSSKELKEYLDEYSMSELWEKNVLGGRP